MDSKEELVKLLSSLIQIDTSNPPGNESELASFLKEWLWERGIRSEILEYEKGRGNLISRIKGSKGPSLLLLSHSDVVPADPARWKIPPFSGIVRDDCIWGRGAIDMKSMIAVEAMIFSEMVDKDLNGDLVFAVTADEERGGSGVRLLLEKNRESIIADYVLNEGGGEGILTKEGWLFDIQTAERGVFWYRISTRGSPAHGSIPGLGINAIEKMIPILNRVLTFKREIEFVNPSWKYVESLLRMTGLIRGVLDKNMVEKALDELTKIDKGLGEAAKSMLKVTMTPTIIRGGVKENIVPYECELTVDCRVPPGYSKNDVSKMINELFQGLECEVNFIQEFEPSSSPIDTPLYKAIEKAILSEVPGAKLEPSTKTGGTDSRYFRKMGIVAYGFQPLKVEGNYYDWFRMIHGDNERISIENLIFSYNVLKRAVESFLS
ncbi:MAG: M20/M25/M40 family metallo-hydrolase [Thermoproteota archaeon]|nr:M20/M25/M40 family metallo-hydrolase [Candidatus Brockarchaeota archaeon]